MAPRLHCLRAVQDVAQKSHCFRAAFSTTAKGMADAPSEPRPVSPSATRSFLSGSLGDGEQHHPAARVGLQIPTSAPLYPSEKRKSRLDSLISIGNMKKQKTREEELANHEAMFKNSMRKDLTKQMKRRWEHGDIYAPKDLSPEEIRKWRGKTKNTYDVFDLLNMNPIDEYKNFSIMSEFMTPMGRIKGSNQTGLRPVNQRKIAKAIRRSIGLGIMPSVHRHPEILLMQKKGTDAAEKRKALQGYSAEPGY